MSLAINYGRSNHGRGGAAPAGVPSWRSALATLRWAEVGGNTLADVDPAADAAVNPNHPGGAPWAGTGGQSQVIDAWSGAAWDDAALKLYLIGGGHADYAGNELYEWDGSTAAFARLTNPTGAIGNTGTLNDGQEATARYFDGQPRSFHTYNNLAIRNGVLWMTGGAVYITGDAASRPFRYDSALAEWVMDTDTSAVASYGSLCYYPPDDVFFIFGTVSSPPAIYNPVTGAKTSHPTGWTPGGDNRSVYDSARDIITIIRTGGQIQVIDPAGVTATVAISTTGTAPTADNGSMGFVYDSVDDRYLAWAGGATVYTLTPSASFRVDPWAWGTLTLDAGNTVTPTAQTGTGTFGRFWISNALGCIGVVNDVAEHMYVLPIRSL